MTDVSFSQDGKWLMSASNDCTIRLWNIAESDKISTANDNKKTVGLRVSTVSRNFLYQTCLIAKISELGNGSNIHKQNFTRHFACKVKQT